MFNIGDSERATQEQVVRFFIEKLHYTSLGNLRAGANRNIRQGDLLLHLLRCGYTEKAATRAIEVLVRTAANLQQGVYYANKEVYSLLKYGAKVKEEVDEPEKTVYFIDFSAPANNTFAIAQEVTIVENNTKRPDIVLYVNGIALAVLELKKSSISVADGIRQNITNQTSQFVEPFFTTIQLCAAGNSSEGVRYGTLLTKEKYYLEWKPDGFTEYRDERDETDLLIEEKCKETPQKLEQQLYYLFYKRRFLDLIHNFVVFDKGDKKVCRYNQFYAVKRAENRLMQKHRGGIIWHTQGSGKSLTMVWLSKLILANDPKARVLIITDREELDEQIKKLYVGVDEKIVRAKSGRDLVERLNAYEDRLVCSLIHKFGKRGEEISEQDYDQYVEELRASLPADFLAKGNFTVFVDECHRTQSGKLHSAMKAILPSATFVGFTGTPLLKKDKKTSLEVFGGYIHTYKFNEGVRDGVILDLRYEARDIPQDITSQERVDTWFEVKTQGLTPRAKARLKAHWGNLQKVFSSRSRLEKIANDIIFDFETSPRLKGGNGNALLVAGSVYAACKYYEIFVSKGFRKCAIISSYTPQPGDLRTDTVSDEEETETFEKYETYLRMIGIEQGEDKKQVVKKVEAFEAEAKRKFVDEPNNMKLLIVVDKLLTGFDAPHCTYLYIDKAMHDHGLFQAICRVNRLDGEDKDFGYIVDYKQLFGDLADAVNKYTTGAFEAYDAEDIDGLLKKRAVEARNYFASILEELDELCEGVEMPRTQLEFTHYFCGENGVDIDVDEAFARSREKLYRLASSLARAYAEFKPWMQDVGCSSAEQKKFEQRVTFYLELRGIIGRASGDFIDLKQYEPGMRYLIDNYISAEDSEKIGILDDFTLLDFIMAQQEKLENGDESAQKSAAEAIENNIRKKIVEKISVNPAYYAQMSKILEQIIDERRQSVRAYKELLKRYIAAVQSINHPETNPRYPETIRQNGALRALYDNCGENEAVAIKLHHAVLSAKQDGFRNNEAKQNRIKRALSQIISDDNEVERIYNLVAQQEEY